MRGKKHIVILSGGPSSEHEVSLHSGEMVARNLNPQKYRIQKVIIRKNGLWQFPGFRKAISLPAALTHLAKRKPDCVFVALHGKFGEDGTIQALLDSAHIRYTGSDIIASALAMDKVVSNIFFEYAGLLVPRYQILEKKNLLRRITRPVVVKPARGGSSVGVSIVKKKFELAAALRRAFKEDSRVMAQDYIAGREITCGVIEKNGKPFALVPTEIVPKTSNFFDYTAKYTKGASEEITPALISKSSLKEIQRLAVQAHNILGCRGMSRSDFILQNSRFYILETNTIPGLTATSLLPQGAAAIGINFPKLLDYIVEAALKK